ncbi:hypothetical protein D9619_003184 [Psilocybe cf. subviscida]|uniref:Protein CPL1-like domain-containing protein n=1 Tax=Psilocybe cf. subviscida TaxID=2480587 RepID=A0A8H5AY87_9AGAR|nr:hypothetical protein D9619_003184 [Psilocybe cf. subviscida]
MDCLKVVFTVLAALVPLGLATSVSTNCKTNEFRWSGKNCCLPKGGPPKPPAPPKGANCPPTSYYWEPKQGCCVPRNPPPHNPPPPQCPKGWYWRPNLWRCEPEPTKPTPPPSHPSPKPYPGGPSHPGGPGGPGNPGHPGGPSGPGGNHGGPGGPGGNHGGPGGPGGNYGGPGNGHHRRAVKSRTSLCPTGLDACPVSGGSGGDYECVDTATELESCGGCPSLGNGQDCTAIKGAWNVGCEQGSCVVLSCAGGFKIGAGRKTRKYLYCGVMPSVTDLISRVLVRMLLFGTLLSRIWSALATPIPLPLPLRAVDYPNSLGLISVNRSIPSTTSGKLDIWSPLTPSARSDRDSRSKKSDFDELYKFYDAANANSDTLRDLATNAEDAEDSELLQQQYASGLSDFNTNLAGFQAAYAKTASGLDDGLANYDRTNDLETMLKNLINLNKYILGSTSAFVNKLPVVGPILGPIIYETKCLIDQILDITENFSDGTINQLTPLLQKLLGEMVTATCDTGVKIAGLCI